MKRRKDSDAVESITVAIHWLEALSAAQPSPAAGSAAALTGALGVALLSNWPGSLGT